MTADFDPSVFTGTVFNRRTAQMNHAARWVAWDQYHLPEVFVGLEVELAAIHNGVMVEDKSPMTKYSFSRPDAAAFLDYLLPRDVSKIEENHLYYTPWCDNNGKLIDEHPVFRLDDGSYVNSGNPMRLWFEQHRGRFDVEIEDISDKFGVLAMQGPKSLRVLEALIPGEDWQSLRFARGRRARLPGGAGVYVWRVGFTGQPGFEFWVPKEFALEVYDGIMAAGEPHGIVPCGHNAQNIARVEAGILMPGLEYMTAGPDALVAAYESTDDEALSSPLELNLGRFIDFDKPTDFVGRHALVEERQRGPARTLMGLEISWRDIVSLYEKIGAPPEISRRISWTRYPLSHEGHHVGHASSVCWSPMLRKMISLCQVRTDLARAGTALSMEWHAESESGDIGVTVVDIPFIEDKRRG